MLYGKRYKYFRKITRIEFLRNNFENLKGSESFTENQKKFLKISIVFEKNVPIEPTGGKLKQKNKKF